MRSIPKEQVRQRIRFENPWWEPPHAIDETYGRMQAREYFRLFSPLVRDTSVGRAVVLMGPRRVGKTVLIHQAIQALIKDGVDPHRIVYVSVENPIYNGLGLEELLRLCKEAVRVGDGPQLYVFFDEIQYLPQWEVHLKSLVDSYRRVKFTVSGSAAAALRLRGIESGAGRFTDFLLPPLTFHEYASLLGRSDLVEHGVGSFECHDVPELNRLFVDYLNFGGYPEALFSETIRSNPGRYIRSDIIDKVLLRDLPSLYGIEDIQELNSLFTSLAYNTAGEVSLEALSQRSGVAKNTIRRYIEYLEAAFLLRRVQRVDRSAKRFKRAVAFKVYLTNPSLRSALFSPVSADDSEVGALVETAIFSQWFHAEDVEKLHYARWPDGEVDLVYRWANGDADWAVEVKWSERPLERLDELSSAIDFCRRNGIEGIGVTTRETSEQMVVRGVKVNFVPASVYCYTVGYNLVRGKKGPVALRSLGKRPK